MTFKELLEMRAEKEWEKPFLYFRDQVIDFGTLDRNVNKAANLLKELGVEKEDHVCLFLPNCPEFLYLWFGLAKIGGVMVPLNVHLRGEGLEYIINHCNAKCIFVNESLYDAFARVEKNLSHIEQRVWHSEDAPPPEDFHGLNKLMETAEDKAPATVDIKDSAPLGIIYTSGTTGPPKGAMLNHFNYINMGKIWVEDKVKGDHTQGSNFIVLLLDRSKMIGKK